MLHPVFAKFAELCKVGAMAICHLTMEGRHCEVDHEIFVEGQDAAGIIFLVSGKLSYVAKQKGASRRLEPGDCIGEPVLWQRWVHCGQLVAASISEIAVLNASKLHALLMDGESIGWPVEPLQLYHTIAERCGNRTLRLPLSISQRRMCPTFGVSHTSADLQSRRSQSGIQIAYL